MVRGFWSMEADKIKKKISSDREKSKKSLVGGLKAHGFG